MKSLLILFLVITSQLARGLDVWVIVSLEGSEEYGEVFSKNVSQWKQACVDGGANYRLFGQQKPSPEGDTTHYDELKQAFQNYSGEELWIVLIGHGSFDKRVAKFNLSGKDFTAKEFGQWCRAIKQPLVVINTASASGSFLQAVAGPNRTVVTATKSPNEINYTRFGDYFSEAITGLEKADLDNDDQVSVLEAFLYASAEVASFYKDAGRLATEHALLEDNGDGLGTRAEWFEGTTAVKVAKKGAKVDGFLSRQKVLVKNELERLIPDDVRQRRDELETQVRIIRGKKAEMSEADYYQKLESLLLELAKIYQQLPTNKPSKK